MKMTPTAIAVLVLVPSCAFTGANVPSDVAEAWDALDAAEKETRNALAGAEEAAEAAALTPGAEDDAPAQVRLQAAQAASDRVATEFARLETDILRRRLGPVVGAVASVTGPWGALLGPLVMAGLPLVGKRGRKLYVSAARNLNPLMVSADGTRGMALVAGVTDIFRALGVLHSGEVASKPRRT